MSADNKTHRRKLGLFCCRTGAKSLGASVRQPKPSKWESRPSNASALPDDPRAISSYERLIASQKRGEGVVAQVPKGDQRLFPSPELSPEDYEELMCLSDQFKGPLLGPQIPRERGRKTLVLDLDETLVHSSFQPAPVAAFVIPVEIETLVYEIYVAKRPGVDEFLSFCMELYEVVIFTASIGRYASPLLDKIDPENKCSWRLYRDACLCWQGSYIKDLSKLGRDLRNVLIVDNSPTSSLLQPDNAIPIRSWFDDEEDRELYELMPILKALAQVDDIQAVMRRTAIYESDEDE